MREDDDPADELAALWARMRPIAVERLDLVIRAVADTDADRPLTDERCAEAAAAAHKLVGSLEMYGYPWATPILREAELLLVGLVEAEVAPVPPALAADLERVRRGITSTSP